MHVKVNVRGSIYSLGHISCMGSDITIFHIIKLLYRNLDMTHDGRVWVLMLSCQVPSPYQGVGFARGSFLMIRCEDSTLVFRLFSLFLAMFFVWGATDFCTQVIERGVEFKEIVDFYRDQRNHQVLSSTK